MISKNYFDSKKLLSENISYRVIKNTSLQNLCNHFILKNTDELMSKTDINDAMVSWHKMIVECYNVVSPVRTCNNTRRSNYNLGKR